MKSLTLVLALFTLLLPAQGQRNDPPPTPGGERPRPNGEARPEPRGDRPPNDPNRPNPQRPTPRPGDGPWNRDVVVYRLAADGTAEKTATFERAGVPTIARLKDGRLIAAHQHFPADDPAAFDKVAVHFSSDDGKTWDATKVIRVDGLPEGMRFPFDPTLVPLPDGKVRLYFTGNMGRTFQASNPAIHSAISEDGIQYTYEPGARFAVEGRPVIDCAAVLHDGVFHLYAPDNGTRLGGPPPQRDRGNARPPQQGEAGGPPKQGEARDRTPGDRPPNQNEPRDRAPGDRPPNQGEARDRAPGDREPNAGPRPPRQNEAPDRGPDRNPDRAPGDGPRDGVGYHATSKDGLTFTRADDVKIEGRRHWLGGAISDGKTITFYGTGEATPEPGQRPRGGIWTATSEDGQTWKATPGPATQGADPGATKAQDGTLVLITTSGPVRNAQPPQRGPK